MNFFLPNGNINENLIEIFLKFKFGKLGKNFKFKFLFERVSRMTAKWISKNVSLSLPKEGFLWTKNWPVATRTGI